MSAIDPPGSSLRDRTRVRDNVSYRSNIPDAIVALGTATIVRSDAELRAAVITGRAVNVVDLGPRLQEVVDAFNRWASATAATVEPRARRGGQSRSA